MDIAALNPLDRLVAAGQVPHRARLPFVLGVEGVGRAGAQRYVVHGCGVGLSRAGTLSETVAVPRGALVRVPSGVSDEHAAMVGVSLATAIGVVGLADLKAGHTALVLGASGVVGASLCSLLHARGIDVTGQVRSVEHGAAVEANGASVAVADTAERLVAAGGVRYDAVLDSLGGEWTSAAIEVAAPRGRVVCYGSSSGPETRLVTAQLYRKALTLAGYGGVGQESRVLRRHIREALDALVAGHLRPVIGHRYPLADAASAWEAMAGPRTGKVLVDISARR